MTDPFAAVSGRRVLQDGYVEKIQEGEKEGEEADPARIAQDVIIQFNETSDEVVAARRDDALFAKEAGNQADQAKGQGNGDYGRHCSG
jgi:hypothetical protein